MVLNHDFWKMGLENCMQDMTCWTIAVSAVLHSSSSNPPAGNDFRILGPNDALKFELIPIKNDASLGPSILR